MRSSGSMVLAIALSVGCGAGALVCYTRASALRTEADWMMARGNAQGAEYAATLDSAVAERQLATLDERRTLLEAAFRWQRIQLLLVMASVVGAFCSYVLYLLVRLRQQLVDVEVPEPGRAEASGR